MICQHLRVWLDPERNLSWRRINKLLAQPKASRYVDMETAKGWTDQQVIEQWNRLYKGHLLPD
jgi:hypothetical protein